MRTESKCLSATSRIRFNEVFSIGTSLAIGQLGSTLQLDLKSERFFSFLLFFQSRPFDKPFFVLLNIAVGGSWWAKSTHLDAYLETKTHWIRLVFVSSCRGGSQGIDESIFPRRMEIDWVYFYQWQWRQTENHVNYSSKKKINERKIHESIVSMKNIFFE